MTILDLPENPGGSVLRPGVTEHEGEPTPYVYDPAHRYVAGTRPVLLTGVQAIARLLVEQHVRDAASGKATETLVSGYPGSPLGGLDKLLLGLPELKQDAGMTLVPGLNEELGATAVWGSQTIPGKRTNDGVIGVWYGKGPGVDRSGDVFRHANTFGASADGGVLVLAGDDPGSKSSTVPAVSERTLASFGMPILAPRTGAELIAFGLYGVALSRATGCWIGMKIVADLADGLWTVDEDFQAMDIVTPEFEWNGRPWTYEQVFVGHPADSVAAEAALFGPRWAAVEAFAAANPIDTIEVNPRGAWLGIAATGFAYDATRQALFELGLTDADLDRLGIRLLRVGMPYPLGAGIVREFATDLEQILVVEEKASFVEGQLKDILYGTANAPAVLGKKDRDGRALVPADGQLTADRLHTALRKILAGRVELPPLPAPARTPLSLTPVASGGAKRTPYFCSGCPHNRSTVIPEGSIGAAGIGCHIMVAFSDRKESQVVGYTQMGGEGTQWIGQAPFTDVDHLFQNMGDGTYAHSGQLAIQAAVASGVNITYKLLYNQVVAMTGAQEAQGGHTVQELTRIFKAQGVAKTVVVTDEPHKYADVTGLEPGTEVRHRDKLDQVQRELREVPGTTVLIYDQQCANEARRLRKRGKQEIRTTKVVIDEAVCEGCGDCGAKSNCLSVLPVDTEFGRKTRIEQTSCNTDYSCLAGDCPSFITVTADTKAKKTRREVGEPVVPAEPANKPDAGDIFITGIGGTGIVTVNQVLATASLRSQKATMGLDQVGLSQKAGPVTSHLRVGEMGPANRVRRGQANALLGIDALVAAEAKNLAVCSPEHTIAVVSTSETPTGTEVNDAQAERTDVRALIESIRPRVKQVFEMDSLGASEALFTSTAPANFLLVGAAYQLGLLPMDASAIEESLELNGVAVKANIAAFRWGRVAVADPAAFAAATGIGVAVPAPVVVALPQTVLDGETRRVAAIRYDLLVHHSSEKVARRYLTLVEEAWAAERRLGESTAFSTAVAKSVAHLAAYKDEYEVARLLTRPELVAEVQAQVPGATDVVFNLHPPMLRAMGMSQKLKLPAKVTPALKAMSKAKGLRGTPLDPFGRAGLRKLERALVEFHTALAKKLTATLTADSLDDAVKALDAAHQVRGYEHVKVAGVRRYLDTLAGLGHDAAPVRAAVAAC